MPRGEPSGSVTYPSLGYGRPDGASMAWDGAGGTIRSVFSNVGCQANAFVNVGNDRKHGRNPAAETGTESAVDGAAAVEDDPAPRRNATHTVPRKRDPTPGTVVPTGHTNLVQLAAFIPRLECVHLACTTCA